MFIDQKTEKDAKIIELNILKEKVIKDHGQVPEITELRMKYESLK